jgi:hypothetical protein
MAARDRAQNLSNRLSRDGYFWSDDAGSRPFWHASDAGLPLVALVRFAEIESAVKMADDNNDLDIWGCPDCLSCACHNMLLMDVLNAIERHYNWLVSITNKVENPFGYARQTYKTNNAIKDGFFIPHDNESDYWWQGEDARIASLAAAAVYADRALNGTVADSVRKYAADQLDWILGKNPYATCMMNGIGKKNPEVYNGQSEYDATLKGGIANGITGKNTDGSGIAWDDDGVAYVGFSSLEPWNNWRWIEQWLPHSTWYLMALATRYDEKAEKIQLPVSIKRTVAVAAGFDVKLAGRTLTVNAANAKSAAVTVVGLDGAKVTSGALVAGYATVDLSSVKSGAYLVKVDGFGAKKVLVR